MGGRGVLDRINKIKRIGVRESGEVALKRVDWCACEDF
jgi:hypothetical protein